MQIWKNYIIQNDPDITNAAYNQAEIPLILYDEAEKHLTIFLNWLSETYGSFDVITSECLFTQSLVAYKRGKIAEAVDGMRNALLPIHTGYYFGAIGGFLMTFFGFVVMGWLLSGIWIYVSNRRQASL